MPIPPLNSFRPHPTFVHLKTPIDPEAALDGSAPDADRRRRPEASCQAAACGLLGIRNSAQAHVNALNAAARLLGHANRHAAQHSAGGDIKLVPMADSGEEVFADCANWHRAFVNGAMHGFRKRHQFLEVRFQPAYVMVFVHSHAYEGGAAEAWDEVPLLVVNPLGDAEHWLQDAPTAFETLRRHLEESGAMVLDTVAVLQLCNRDSKEVLERLPSILQPVQPTDA
ncbi:MAG: hypothetical protein MZV65_48815 [Chromatiales bacterium]|nr:hypothetical protein [Chromatiales bacterium]